MLQATVSGSELTLSVGFRLPAGTYEQATRRAWERNVKLSVILREAVVAGLSMTAADGHQVADGQQVRAD